MCLHGQHSFRYAKAFIGKAHGEYWEIDVATAMRNSKTEIRLPEIYYTLAYCNFLQKHTNTHKHEICNF